MDYQLGLIIWNPIDQLEMINWSPIDQYQLIMNIQYLISAGPTPRGTWVTDQNEGGGRIVGEMCHFIDLCSFFIQSMPIRVYAQANSRDLESDDSVQAIISYADGSTATLSYLTQSHAQLPKERFSVSAEGKTAICDNFKQTQIIGSKDFKQLNQDKGQTTAIKEFILALRKGQGSPFELSDLISTSEVTFAIARSITTHSAVSIGESQ